MRGETANSFCLKQIDYYAETCYDGIYFMDFKDEFF